MELGFETIGNAILIAFDGGPVLATDPWIIGPAYFGSWTRSHEIPAAQMDAILGARFLWISHGHPDHLSMESLAVLRDKEILLPDHFGCQGRGLAGAASGRIARELTEQGFRVRVLRDGVWTQLSPRLRVACVSDYNQDAVLLLDLDGHLLIDANDASDRGCRAFLERELARATKDSYLLWLTGYGDADMIHWLDEDGRPVPPPGAAKEPIGPVIAEALHELGVKRFIPFSAMHRYQRTDSAWANEFATPSLAHAEGFRSDRAEILPPFAHVDLLRDEVRGLAPAPSPQGLHEPEEFGDNWSETLTGEDVERIKAYFAPLEHLKRWLGWIEFGVGGQSHVITIAPEHRTVGLTLEAPRHSLMTVVEHRTFDDLLIGNFVRGTTHGPWERRGVEALYPDFTPFVCKYADNGGARSVAELRAYFDAYRRRGFFGFNDTPSGQRERRAIDSYL